MEGLINKILEDLEVKTKQLEELTQLYSEIIQNLYKGYLNKINSVLNLEEQN